MSDKTPKKPIDLTRGILSNANPHNAPIVEQDNLTLVVAGQVTGRAGYAPVTFTSEQGSSDTHSVYSMYHYQHPLSEWVIWSDSNGDVHCGNL